MEKEPQPDSLTDVTIKQYASSEVYSTEPPPAYHRPQSTAVQVARICALTVVAVSVVLGGFILAAAYVQSNASCQQWQQEMQLLQEEQKLQQGYNHQAPLQPEALTQEEPHDRQHHADSHAEHSNIDKNIDDNSISQDSSESDDDSSSEEEERTPIHIKLPLQLDFDELAGILMEKNQRSRMNCIVEKKKAEEVIDHQPKSIRLPFGLNLTTDPRYEHVTGERMAIFCESGDDQRPVPQQEETMMVQPIIVPLGAMGGPIQFHGGNLQHQPPQMRPQPPPMDQHPQFEAIRAHTVVMEPMQQRPPIPVQHNVPSQHNQMTPPVTPHHNPLMQHIAQQIIAQHEMAAAAARQQHAQQQAQQQHGQPNHEIPQPHLMHQMPHPKMGMQMPEGRLHQIPNNRIPEMIAQRLHHMPEEILTQINRLPNQDQVISVTVSEHEAEELPHNEVRMVQHPRESAQEMNGRQSFARAMPVHIPVPMMQHLQQQEQQQQQQEQLRPHYVQPRSVRSVDSVLHREKRVKRCSCDCAC